MNLVIQIKFLDCVTPYILKANFCVYFFVYKSSNALYLQGLGYRDWPIHLSERWTPFSVTSHYNDHPAIPPPSVLLDSLF
jgi:hypothetical protein